MPERFLIVQLADIGDLILSTPALAALRQARPDAHITLLTTTHSAPIIESTNLVDDILTINRQQLNGSLAFFHPSNLRRLLGLRARKMDAVIFLHHFTLALGTLKFALIAFASGAKRRIGLDNGRGWFLTESLPDLGFGAKHQAQYWLDLVALLGASSLPRPAQVSQDEYLLPPSTHDPAHKLTVVLHPGSGGYSLARRWDSTAFARVADELVARYQARIILVGSPSDDTESVRLAMQFPPLDLTGKTTLARLASVIRAADLFIGADSGVMHIAAAVGTPLIAIFGPSNAAAWGPWTPSTPSIVLRSAPECSPCSYIGHEIGLRHGCPARTCMRLVTPDHVLNAVEQLQQQKTSPSSPTLSSPPPAPERIYILGLPVDPITYPQWLDRITAWIAQPSHPPRHVCTVNPEFMMIARSDSNFRSILRRADLCVPDGVGLLWAARYLGKPLPQRVTGSDGVPIIAEHAAQNGWRLFFLGAAPGVADKAAAVLQSRYPALQIVGIYSGSPSPHEEDSIVERVNAAQPDILFVAYGAPEQDKWIARNLPRLRVRMAMGVGGSFDFIAGIIPRAPHWMRRAGLEWLYRLYLQPWRIRRMMRLPQFVLAVLLRGEHA